MKTFSLVLLSLLIGLSISDRSFAEVYTTGSAVDNNGNIFIIGYCLGNVRIADLEYTITQPSAFILKLDSDGEMIWVKFINSNQSIKANAVAVDGYGNVYVTGEFSGTANFDSYSLIAQGTDAFIVKHNASGNVEWVKHGQSSGTARGNDIYVKEDLVFICGYGKPIAFDSLSITGGGFTVTYNSNGTVFNLFKTREISYKIIVDTNNNIVISGSEYNTVPVPGFWPPSISKFSMDGTLLWVDWYYVQNSHSICSDNINNIYSLEGYFDSGVRLKKYDADGNVVNYYSFDSSGTQYGRALALRNDSRLAFCGYYSTVFHFGDSTLQSNGLKDFFLAVVDTGFNPIWITGGGGLYDDELNSISLLNDGNILCGGNFKGTISIDTLEITGGNYADDKWAGIVKYDMDGNLIWVKKLVENYTTPTTVNWFPLEVGNKFQYFKKYSSYWGNEYGDYSIKLFQVTDSVWLNNQKYYSVDGFYFFSSGTKIRYDQETQQIVVLYNNQEYLFMDFTKVDGEIFQQTNGSGGFINSTIISQNIVILEDTLAAKGFYNIRRLGGGGWPPLPSGDLATWVYFAPEIGWVFQDQENYITSLPKTDLFLIEQLIFEEGQYLHKKHSETATLLFEPVTFIAEGDSLYQVFTVLHPFSKQNVPASNGYFSYINAFLESFYFNGSDTVWNPQFNIQQTSEIDFSLNYQFDTTKYQQGYHLYYRIAAVDKGIIPDTFYSPQEGYYKLFWKDSTTSVSPVDFLPSEYSLYQNFPNPFNPSSRIVFTIPERNFVSLKVFDLLGSEIISLVNEELDAGRYEVDFSGDNLSSGVYIYQIRAGSFIDTKKMILIR